MSQRYPLHLLEQLLSSITHGIGLVLAIIGLVGALVWSQFANTSQLVGFIVFGVTLILLYLCSTLYHALSHTRAEPVMGRLDYAAIFVFIAGTYTPLILSLQHGLAAVMLLTTVWGMALGGSLLAILNPQRMERYALHLYLTMGWLGLYLAASLLDYTVRPVLWLVILGGLSYAIGTIFFASRRIPLGHTIWHVFVMAGSALHYAAIIKLT